MNIKNKIRNRAKQFLGVRDCTPNPPPAEPDMDFQRRVAMKETIFNVSTATRFEVDSENNVDSLRGDYMEFGVFRGAMFKYVLKEAGERMPWMRFFACDSFEGLPEPEGIDACAEFVGGQFKCSYEEFLNALNCETVESKRIIAVPGWFDKSLDEAKMSVHGIKIVTIAYIDCDLYLSCVPVLKFLTSRVKQGSVLMFDDWYCFRADPFRGIQLAVSEWLLENPHIELTPWKSFSSHGQSFFVNIKTI